MGLIIKNNVVYNGAESEPIIYSEEEREVGVWTDGKPLYQKSINVGSIAAATASTTNHNISNLENVISIVSTGFNTVEQRWNVIPRVDDAVAYQRSINVNNTQIIIQGPSQSQPLTNVNVTVQYTKTTDQPGSGTWTPSGIKTVHYSENEQVVGTWVNGKTIYEKTFSEIPLGSDGNYNLFSSGIDIAFLVSCYYVENGTGVIGSPSYISRYGAGGNCSQYLELTNHSLTLWNQSTKSILWTGTVRYIKTV